MKSKSKWVKVGIFGVDSAMVFIGDPALLFRSGHPLNGAIKKGRIDWSKLMGPKHPTMRQLGKHYGVISSTGWGDGVYEVEARVVTKTLGSDKNVSTTKRVAELRIVFIEDEEVAPHVHVRASAVQIGNGNKMVVRRRRSKPR